MWFSHNFKDSEQLVLDGILKSESDGPSQPVILGIYNRDHIRNQNLVAHLLYNSKNRDGDFTEYHSQFGLQGKIFAFLAYKGFSLSHLQLFVSSAMALCLSASYLILRSNGFSGLASLSFSACLALSPWIIMFARNLYWVEFTWFLPPIVAAMYASMSLRTRIGARFKARMQSLFWIGLFYAVVLIKLLCGYEYITTIYFASILSFIGLSLKRNVDISIILKSVIALSLATIIAFGSAVYMHSVQLQSIGQPGLETIYKAALKRSSSTDNSAIDENLCKGPLSSDTTDTCAIALSLNADPFNVAIRYLFVPAFLPWIEPNNILNKIGFPLFVIILLVSFRSRPLVLLYIIALFFGSASWFFAAKGHSFIHYHLNYVLWYILFVPVGVLLLVEKFVRKLPFRFGLVKGFPDPG